MKRYCMPTVLLLSLLLNVGVIFSVGFQAVKTGIASHVFGHGAEPVFLEEYLHLTAEQLPLWRTHEHMFMSELSEASRSIAHHRENMIREIFSDSPRTEVVENERRAIAQLQETQQRQVIQQLLREREILDPKQRHMLSQLLLDSDGSVEQVSSQLHQH